MRTLRWWVGSRPGTAPAGRALLIAALTLAACAPVPLPRASPYHPSDAALGISRVIHGAVIVELRGTRILVDPWFHSGLFVRQ